MSIWRWSQYFTDVPEQHRITLGEGNTPIVRSRRIGPAAGLNHLYFKLETANPTGSYKDRFGAAAIAGMLAAGKSHCVATSSGNTGAAVAAYSAAAGITCEIAVVETAPPGKLRQMMVYGANIYRIRGFGLDPQISADAFKLVQQRGSAARAQMQISAFTYSPVGMAGVKTMSYEIAEQVEQGAVPAVDHVFVQAGGGGLTLAVARGFVDMVAAKRLSRGPRVHCVQPEGNDTIASALRNGDAKAKLVQCTSAISGLQVPSVIDGDMVVQACRASGGTGHAVTDAAVWDVQRRLAVEEGIFCEPAGATALAGALQAVTRGEIRADDMVVCIVTGSGFKDEPSVDRMLADVSCPTLDLAELR
jgi:threonine synthase